MVYDWLLGGCTVFWVYVAPKSLKWTKDTNFTGATSCSLSCCRHPSAKEWTFSTWNFMSLKIQTFKDMFIKCKILIFFLFLKNAAEMFYAWHNPAIRWVNKPRWKKRKSHPNTPVKCSFYSFVKVLCSRPQMSSVFSFCCSFKNKLKSLRKKLRRIRG